MVTLPRKSLAALALLSGTALCTGTLHAQSGNGFGPLDPAPPSGRSVDEIIKTFGARESAFRKARENYTFRQSVRIQTINDDNNKPDGEYSQVTDIGFDRSGKRTENVVFAPQNTLERVTLDQSDFEDLRIRLPLVLTTEDLPEYDVRYLGRQKVDELDTYVFQATPRVQDINHRHFEGKVWVDQRDLQIVMISGKNTPDDIKHNHFSIPFTTYYEEIDDKNWFPTYTRSEGTVHFAAQHDVAANEIHMRSTVKYTDYRQFRSSARILYNGAEVKTEIDPNAKPDGNTNPDGSGRTGTSPTPDAGNPGPTVTPGPDVDPSTGPAPARRPKP